MSIFKKQIAAPAPRTGTEIIRSQLKSRTRHRSLLKIAEDICDQLTLEANRATAKVMARKAAPDDASDAVLSSLAKRLMLDLGVDVNRIRTVPEDALKRFMDGGDISTEIKIRLVIYFDGAHKTFDPVEDKIVLVHQNRAVASYILPPPWRHPNPKIAAAQDALHAAQREARGG